MTRRTLRIVIGSVALLGGSFLVSAQDRAPSSQATADQRPVRYEAEPGLPRDKAGEERRDFAVLEAALNDLASPKNPEHRAYIEKWRGPGREIVVNREIVVDDEEHPGDLEFIGIGHESRNIDGQDPRRIPAEIQEDFRRRLRGPGRSLKGFKPANPNILVLDLDRMFEEWDRPVEMFVEKYPKAWGYVWAYPPAYSKDGKLAVVVFQGGPNGGHPLDWKYMLTRDRNRWLVLWRHCHPWE